MRMLLLGMAGVMQAGGAAAARVTGAITAATRDRPSLQFVIKTVHTLCANKGSGVLQQHVDGFM